MPDAAWIELRPERTSWIPTRSQPRQSFAQAAEFALTADKKGPLRAVQVDFVPVGELIPLARLLNVSCGGEPAYDQRTPGDFLAGFPCLFQGEDTASPAYMVEGPWLFAVDRPLLDRLANLGDDELGTVADQWEASAYDAHAFLEDTRAFLRGVGEMKNVYYWHGI